ncbi:hypothetical protein [Agrobacterium rosae]|uniref:hypothetical protein n=1 Tax=Agrobacterium rosae TaxID=1972867 RepID=UPI0020340798|nr:hypothetical protein [Agrobacterium rosae]MCM2432080.1 hypothetical protein [Agrobacterium rosae]
MTEENNDILRGVWEIAGFMGEDPRGLTASDIDQCPVPSFWENGVVCASKEAVQKYLEAENKTRLTPTPIASFFLDEISTIAPADLGRIFFEKFHPCTREEFTQGHSQASDIAAYRITAAASEIENYRPV